MKHLIFFVLFSLFVPFLTQGQSVLMFVAHEDTYYSEYVVMRKTLEAAGYTVEVRSASAQPASIYMIPNGTDIEATANTLAGSNYTQFTQKFADLTGATWQTAWNATPTFENVTGAIQDVNDMSNYAALVIVGGTGALAYRIDGTYSSQGTAARELSAATIQAAAEKLNALALEALAAGKPVMAQCHGSSLAPFWRIPNTSGPGAEILGYSLLKDQYATGFPDGQTPVDLASLNVNFRAEDRVCISSPHSSFVHNGNADYKIITTRDWYPQTVLYAAQTLMNIIETYPTQTQQEAVKQVLILHGGAVDVNNCHYTNRANDIPCNYGGGANLPADYTDIVNLLNANSANDNYDFVVTDLNLTGTLPYNANNQAEILTYLNQFQTVIFFKHWSTGITTALQNALVQYADEGGGVIALHHGLYNDIDGSLNKDILVSQLFGAQSAMNTWSANLTNYQLFSTNHGHFISSFGINYDAAAQAPAAWGGSSLLAGTNASYSYYSPFAIYDELYNNMSFEAGQTFGTEVNEITPIFSNNQTPSSQVHTSGFVKLFNPALDATVGKVVYFEVGERKESININHRYGQAVRNAVVWAAKNSGGALPVEMSVFSVNCAKDKYKLHWTTESEKQSDYFAIEKSTASNIWQEVGRVKSAGNSNNPKHYTFSLPVIDLDVAYFRLRQSDLDGKYRYSSIVKSACVGTQAEVSIAPNPVDNAVTISFSVAQQAPVSVTIYQQNGQKAYQSYTEQFTDAIEIDLRHLPAGLYWVEIVGANLRSVHKLMKL